jgi:hypothetical protein
MFLFMIVIYLLWVFQLGGNYEIFFAEAIEFNSL